MLAQLEELLRDQAEPGWTLDASDHGVRITAATREIFYDMGDAMGAAEDLLDSMRALGYRLRGGMVGAQSPIETVGAEPWRGRLVDVVLAEDPESAHGTRLRSV